MIEANQYIETVESYFGFLTTEFDFKVSEEKIIGNAFYDVQYKDETRIVSVSYENIEDYLLVIIFLLQNGKLPDYDDKTKTLHLNQLNAKVLPSIDRTEINVNNEYFLTLFCQIRKYIALLTKRLSGGCLVKMYLKKISMLLFTN